MSAGSTRQRRQHIFNAYTVCRHCFSVLKHFCNSCLFSFHNTESNLNILGILTLKLCLYSEWYSYHFPELVKIVNDNYLYAKVAQFVKDRKSLTDDSVEALEAIVMDSAKAQAIVAASKTSMGQCWEGTQSRLFGLSSCSLSIVWWIRVSERFSCHQYFSSTGPVSMAGKFRVYFVRLSIYCIQCWAGMDISPIDLINISRFTDRVIALSDYRASLHQYLQSKMHTIAPNLSALIGEQVWHRFGVASRGAASLGCAITWYGSMCVYV